MRQYENDALVLIMYSVVCIATGFVLGFVVGLLL